MKIYRIPFIEGHLRWKAFLKTHKLTQIQVANMMGIYSNEKAISNILHNARKRNKWFPTNLTSIMNFYDEMEVQRLKDHNKLREDYIKAVQQL